MRYSPQGMPGSRSQDRTGQDVPPHTQHANILNKGLVYINMTPKGETEGVLAFIVPAAEHRMVLNRVHRDAGHQGQQRTLALAQERFWWPMMAEDCRAIVSRWPHCQAFKGEVPRTPLCLI